MKKELKWNVYVDFTHSKGQDDEISVANVFEISSRFWGCLVDLKKEIKKNPSVDYEWFSKELRRWAMWSFWGKSEYEIGLTTWPCYIDKGDLAKAVEEAKETKETKSDHVMLFPNVYTKVDVFMQLDMNWDVFARYTFENISLIKG